MGGTKSKVDGNSEEGIISTESDTSSQTSESTERNTEYTSDLHERHKGRNPKRKKRRGDSTLSPDEVLDKPFTYRSRKDRLLESLNVGAGDCNDDSSVVDSCEKSRKGKISVQKIVNNIQANLNAKSSSTSTIKDVQEVKKPSKKLNLSNDSSNKKSSRRNSSSKLVTSSKEVKPTGAEEKIIKSLIKPTKRQSSVPRSVKIRESASSINVVSNTAAISFDNEVSQNIAPEPPDPPPIDFFDEPKEEVSQKLDDIIPTSLQGKDSILSTTEPSHLKELKLRFSNDVPRSPYEDNLNSALITEKSPPKPLEKPLNRQDSPSKSFTNNVPVADSLHILTNKPGSSKVVIRGAKNQDKRSNEHRNKHRSSHGPDSNQGKQLNLDNALESSKYKAGHVSGPTSSSPKTILKSNCDDIITCFPVKTDYKAETNEETILSTEFRGARLKNSNTDYLKTSRTQTSSLGLVDSGVQTLPDLGLQGRPRKDEDTDYESAVNNKAKKVLRRVSMDRSVDRKTSKDKRGRRYRNGSTQWEEVDLLDNSSCSMLNQKGSDQPRPHSSKSRSRARIKENKQLSHCDEDCQGSCNKNEVCCMHLQVIPGPSTDRRSTHRESLPSKNSDLFRKQESKVRTRGEKIKNCEGCPRSGLSSEILTACASQSASSGISQELSLLPTGSTSTVRSKNKPKVRNEDVYKQMQELGLGFLRDGEWVRPGRI